MGGRGWQVPFFLESWPPRLGAMPTLVVDMIWLPLRKPGSAACSPVIQHCGSRGTQPTCLLSRSARLASMAPARHMAPRVACRHAAQTRVGMPASLLTRRFRVVRACHPSPAITPWALRPVDNGGSCDPAWTARCPRSTPFGSCSNRCASRCQRCAGVRCRRARAGVNLRREDSAASVSPAVASLVNSRSSSSIS